MFGPRVILGQDSGDVAQRLTSLRDEVVPRQRAGFVPPDLAGNVDLSTTGGHAVGIPARTGPTGRLQNPVAHVVSFKRKRCSFPVSVLGSAVTNSTSRGYLYGAIVAFTWFWIAPLSASSPVTPGFKTIKAFTACPRSMSGTPTTAHSSTASCWSTAASTSGAPML